MKWKVYKTSDSMWLSFRKPWVLENPQGMCSHFPTWQSCVYMLREWKAV